MPDGLLHSIAARPLNDVSTRQQPQELSNRPCSIPGIAGFYDLSGRQLQTKARGPIIIRYSDGTSRKVMMK